MWARLAALLQAHRAEALLGLLLLGSYAYFYPSLGHNESARLDLVRAIVEDRSLSVDRFRYNSADLVVHGGRSYSNKAPGASVAALPAFAFWRFALAQYPLAEWAYWDAVAHLTTLGSVGLISTLAGVLSFGLVRSVTRDPLAAAGAIVAVWLGTLVFPFSTALFGHAVAGGLVAVAFALLAASRRQQAPGWSRSALAGVACGAAIATEYPTALLAALLGLYALDTARQRGRPGLVAALAFGLGLAPGVLALALYNHAAFGDAFFPSYQAYVEEGRTAAFGAHALGYAGVHWPGASGFLRTLYEITLAPQRGLLYIGLEGARVYACNPVLWLALPGLVLMARRAELRSEAVLITAAAAAMLGFNACYGDSVVYWGGGASIGPRHLVPLLPLFALPLAVAARRWPWLFLPLLLISFFSMLLATAIELRAPYEHANPFREFLLPHYLRGRLALHKGALFDPAERWSGSPAGAFNLGGLIGLPGPLQLLPYLAFSGVLAGALCAKLAPAARWLPRLLGVALAGLAVPPLVHGLGVPAPARGLVAEYFQNARWAGSPSELCQQPALDIDFRDEPAFPPPFSARWHGALRIQVAGTYLFRLEADDEAFLELDGRQVAEAHGTARRARPVALHLGAGLHPLAVRLANRDGGARLRLLWTRPAAREEPVPASVLGP